MLPYLARLMRRAAVYLDPTRQLPDMVTIFVMLTRPVDADRLNSAYLDGIRDGREEACRDLAALQSDLLRLP